MFNVIVAFEVFDAGDRATHGWSKVTGHLVWDVIGKVKKHDLAVMEWCLESTMTTHSSTPSFMRMSSLMGK